MVGGAWLVDRRRKGVVTPGRGRRDAEAGQEEDEGLGVGCGPARSLVVGRSRSRFLFS